MFLPLHDKNHLRHIRFQGVTIALIVTNCLVFFWQTSLTPQQAELVYLQGGLVPSAFLTSTVLPPDINFWPIWSSLFSHMFLHGSWMHLGINMLFLWVFGDNVEDAMGHLRFLAFYLICGVCAALAHTYFSADSTVPMVGASGATSGIIGAYLLLYPRVRVWVLAFLRIPVRIPAYWALIAWFVFQIAFVFLADDSGTAWWAHIGGFIAGVLLVGLMRRRGVPLFGPVPSASA